MKNSTNTLTALTKAAAASLALVTGFAFAQGHGGMDMKAMMKENNAKMEAMPSTGKPDVDFAMMMREHHMGALEMAQHELQHGKDAKMKSMARKIIAAQKKEIAEFDAFLAKAGHPVAKK